MKTITAEQFEQQYGSDALAQFSAQAPLPSFSQRVSADISARGEQVANTFAQPASTPTQILAQGTQATAQTFGILPDVLAEAIRSVPGGEKALDVLGGVTSTTFRAITDKLGSTKFFEEAATGLEPQGTTENLLETASGLGEISADILIADAAAKTPNATFIQARNMVNRIKPTFPQGGAVVGGASRIINKIKGGQSYTASTIRDLVPTTEKIINTQISKGLDLTPGDINKLSRTTGNDFGKWMADNNLIGVNKLTTVKLIEDFTNNAYKAVREEVGKIAATYKPSQIPRFTDALKQIQEQVRGVVGLEKTAVEVDNFLHKTSLTLNDVQRVKELLDEYFSLYKVTGDVKEGAAKVGVANMRREIKTFIETKVKESGGKDIAKLNKDVQTGKGILEAVATRNPKTLTAKDSIVRNAAAFWFGSYFGGLPGGIAAIFIRRAWSTPTVRLRIARFLDQLSDAQKARIKAKLETGEVPPELKAITQEAQTRTGQSAPQSLSASSFDITTLPKELQPLAKEAQKYSSAEEFVNSIERGIIPARGDNLLYRGVGNNYSQTININKIDEFLADRSKGTYFTKSASKAAEYGKVQPFTLVPNAKIASKETFYKTAQDVGNTRKVIEPALTKAGYDGYINQLGEIVILNNEAIKPLTKSQLTDLWNKVHGK